MAKVRCDGAISSITLVTSGVVATSADTGYDIGTALFDCTANEATALCGGNGNKCVISSTYVQNPNPGPVDVRCPARITTSASASALVITSITINGHVYTMNTDFLLHSLFPADATALLGCGFKLVTG